MNARFWLRPRRAAALAGMFMGTAVLGQELQGHWEGQIAIPNAPLVVEVDLARNDASPGGWRGTIDIPAQNATGLTLSPITVGDGGRVEFAIHGVPGNPTFKGQLAAGVIEGRFEQGGAEFPFRLSREAMAGPKRPQEPQPPFPYAAEEVAFNNGPVRLAGTLTVPAGDGPFPAVLLITGSGLQNRDQELFGHKPFRVIADHLSRAGIAVLRVDDAGAGASTAHPSPPTTADFARDAAAGVAFLNADARFASVGVLGHSEGGAIATLLASRRDDVDFVVLLAAPGVPGAEVLGTQNQRIFDAAGIPEGRKTALLALLDELFGVLISDAADADVQREVERIVRRQMELNGLPPAQQDDAQVQAMVTQTTTPWMRYFLAHDPRPSITATRVPVLALNGELDVQVDAEQNLGALAAAFAAGGNENVTIHRLPGLNHLFQPAETGLMNEYAAIEETISPQVLDLIRDWVHATTQGKTN